MACERPLVDRSLQVRIGSRVAVPREVLADGRHPLRLQPLHERAGELGDGLGIVVKSTVADGRAVAVGEVEHGREAQVHAAGRELGADQHAGRARGRQRLRPVAHPTAGPRFAIGGSRV